MRTTRTRKPQETYPFTLILSGVSELTDELQDALFESGCDDALLGTRDGVVYLDFDREASSFREAVLSAIADVERAGVGARVVRVEPDELVTMAEVARRTGRSRESIRQLATGMRGPGGFPPPVASLTNNSPIWRWTDVVQWFTEKKGESGVGRPHGGATRSSGLIPDRAGLVAAVNAALDLRRHASTIPEATDLYDVLRGLGRAGERPRKEAKVRASRED
jgi:hypothetical protein